MIDDVNQTSVECDLRGLLLVEESSAIFCTVHVSSFKSIETMHANDELEDLSRVVPK